MKDGVTESVTYTYDVLNQLTKVVDGSVTRKYSYDEFNNRSAKEETGKSKITYSYNSLNQLIDEKQGTKEKTYTYDRRGSLSKVQENGFVTESYTFDSTGMLSQVIGHDTGIISSYVYDGIGNRVSSKVTENGVIECEKEYVIDTQSAYGDIVGAIDTTETWNTKTSYYTYGKGLVSTDEGGIIGYYRVDEKGTVTDILDKSGVVKASFDYDEFGVLGSTEGLDSYGNIFAYTGHVYDDSTGLYYAKARYYDSNNGRFISEDSYKGEINSAVTLNRYIYTLNNPIIYTDPSGNIIGIDDAIIFLIFAVGSIVLVTYAYLLTPAGKNAINSGAVAVYEGRIIAGKLITKAAKTAFSAIRAGTIQIGNKIADGITWTGNKINDGATWVGNKISDAWGSLTSKISGKKESDKVEENTELPNQGTVQGEVEGAPPVDAGKQGKHVPGHNNNVSSKSQWKQGKTGVNETQKAWQNGTKLPDGTKVWDTGKVVGQNGETGVRVHIDGRGNIHGYPVNPGQYLK